MTLLDFLVMQSCVMSECCDAGALLVCGVVMGAMVCEEMGECIEREKCSFESMSVVCVGDCK